MQIDRSNTSNEIFCVECLLVKANALVSGNICHRYHHSSIIVFTKQPSAERYLANIFCQYFCELLENSCSASKKKTFQKFLESSQKSTHGKVLFQ